MLWRRRDETGDGLSFCLFQASALWLCVHPAWAQEGAPAASVTTEARAEPPAADDSSAQPDSPPEGSASGGRAAKLYHRYCGMHRCRSLLPISWARPCRRTFT